MPDPVYNFRIRLKEYNTYSLNDSGYIATARLIYHVNDLGAAPTADILRAVRNAAPATIEGSKRGTTDLVNLTKADCCDVAVNYVEITSERADAPSSRRENDTKWSFDMGSGQFTMRNALSQVAVIDASIGHVLESSVGMQIGWNGKFGADAACTGVSVYTPNLRLTCRRTVKATTAQGSAFETTIMGLQNHVNSATFRGMDAGQVLFIGATIGEEYYNDEGKLLCDVTYSFAVRLNEPSRIIGNVSLPATNGWDYAWTTSLFSQSEQKLVTQLGVVSRVYEYGDLTGLGIGS